MANVSVWVIAQSDGPLTFGNVAESVAQIAELLRTKSVMDAVPVFLNADDAHSAALLWSAHGIDNATARFVSTTEELDFILTKLELTHEHVGLYEPGATKPKEVSFAAFRRRASGG